MSNKEFVPYVPPDKVIPELTARSVILGVILAMIMCAANAYLGLKIGITVSASIPAAVISLAILKGVLRRGTILENNIVQTITSTGESLAAGIIFTVPALVLTGVWEDFKFIETTLIALLGGCLGVLFMIPLRRALIVEEKQLAFPEGVACAEVLKVGETGGIGFVYIFGGIIGGVIFKLFTSLFGWVKSAWETAWQRGDSTIYYAGSDISPMLVSVGYIVGLNVASLVFIGGLIGWAIAIPIISAAQGAGEGELLDIAWTIWDTKIRYLGVGAMVVGGLWTIVSIRHAIVDSVKATLKGISDKGTAAVKRTEEDLGFNVIFPSIIIVTIATIILYMSFTNFAIGLLSGIIMVIAAFFFVAVASYIVGLVGSSNSPVSGMTICTLLFASVLLLIFGIEGDQGILAALGIAGVVCCAACTSGDISQDLKTGYLVGATPRLQQITQFLGVIFPAFIIAPILHLLYNAYGFEKPATEGTEYLLAPQANLFKSLSEMIFDKTGLPWDMLISGAVIGILLVVIDEILKATKAPVRTHVMAVAVGIYLPVSMGVPIFLGGLIHFLIWRLKVGQGLKKVFGAIQRGVLFASGLIAGEALIGIILAFPRIAGITLPLEGTAVSDTIAWVLTSLVILIILGLFFVIAFQSRKDSEES